MEAARHITQLNAARGMVSDHRILLDTLVNVMDHALDRVAELETLLGKFMADGVVNDESPFVRRDED